MSLESAVVNTISGLQTFETRQKINYQLAAKQLDVLQEQGELVVELIQGASAQGKTPGTGGKFDAQG